MLKKKQFTHGGLRKLALKGEADGVPAGALGRIRRVVAALNVAEDPSELAIPGQGFESGGKKSDAYAVAVPGGRITFTWDRTGLSNIDLEAG
jgi:plasmid maintenance system killer protein